MKVFVKQYVEWKVASKLYETLEKLLKEANPALLSRLESRPTIPIGEERQQIKDIGEGFISDF